MVSRILLKYGLFILLVISNSLVAAESYSPADFTDSNRSLQNRIRFPNIEGDISLTILCDSFLTRNGRFRTNLCFSHGTDQRAWLFDIAIKRAARYAKIQQALVNGHGRAVRFKYKVEFEKNGETTSIKALANQGLNTESDEGNYVSAQRYKGGSGRIGYLDGCGQSTRLWLYALIDESGKPSATKIIGGNGYEGCKQGLQNKFMKGSYVPATLNGQPVTSLHRELFFVTPLVL